MSLEMLHPQMAAVLDQFKDAPPLDVTTDDIAHVRSLMASMTLPAPAEPLHEVRDLRIPGPTGDIPARLYRPQDKPAAPVMVYFHGGGWVIGSIDSHDALCRHLALMTGINVVSVNYRLAPEHVFPAALDDCWAATQWVAAHADSLQCDGAQLMVAGDSAGGNLALATSLKAKAAGWQGIRQQLLLYPVIDARMDSASFDAFTHMPMLSREGMAWMWNAYHPSRPIHPLASLADVSDVTGLPPTILITAELDVLRDEGEAMAQRLQQAGVPVVHQRIAGMPHGFANFSTLVPAIEQTLRDICRHVLLAREGVVA